MGAGKDLIILYRQEAHSSRLGNLPNRTCAFPAIIGYIILSITLHGCLRYQGPEVYQRAVCVMVNMIL